MVAHGLTAPSAAAIAHGQDAEHGAHRFAIKLLADGVPRQDGTTYDSSCSGALVARQWIMTAGHCFHDTARRPVSGPPPYPVTAVVGRTDDGDVTDGQTAAVTEVRQAPQGDIALARLAEPVDDIDPIRLSTRPPRVGETLTLAGWGQTSGRDPRLPNRLQVGRFRIHSVEAVAATVTAAGPRSDTSACASDSGAPYFADGAHPELMAVESGGPTCPHALPETTTRVDVIADWVGSVVSDTA